MDPRFTIPPVIVDNRAPLIGAVVAVVLGIGLGAAMKTEVEALALTGQQQQVSEASGRPRSAMDDWYPAEGAPPPPLQTVDMAMRSADDDAIDREIARLLDTGRVAARPVAPEPMQTARREIPPEVYLPSAEGDILAPADAPRWAAPPASEALPVAYEPDSAD